MPRSQGGIRPHSSEGYIDIESEALGHYDEEGNDTCLKTLRLGGVIKKDQCPKEKNEGEP